MEQEPRLDGAESENLRSKNAKSMCEGIEFIHIGFSSVEGGQRQWQNDVMDRRRTLVVKSSLKLNGYSEGHLASSARA
ncbi:hypothetical protein FNV43_RR21242 [Rhamnella rubrinervis]|uniref:Uncharacterized protein n=1 Tax=Rhamnella rubrinervis TaxID=2594499 RepID=A0A8K0E2Z4_9ROSA|nr:hypothetical protein FNV43_RR21242 [Rhamnella rubrinervis]